jgi:hypothetical protein
MSKSAGGNAQKGPLYLAIETFPTLVDARHANQEAVDLFNRFFATKSRHDCDATMEFISRDLSVYVDATLGWELNGYDALKEVWAQYMPLPVLGYATLPPSLWRCYPVATRKARPRSLATTASLKIVA